MFQICTVAEQSLLVFFGGENTFKIKVKIPKGIGKTYLRFGVLFVVLYFWRPWRSVSLFVFLRLVRLCVKPLSL